MLSKRLVVWMSVLACSALLVACGGGQEEPAAAPEQDGAATEEATGGGAGEEQERHEAALIVPGNFGSTPNYVALELGHWRDRGLDVQMSTLDTGSEIAAAVQAGEADFGGISVASSVPPAAAAGLPFKVFVPYMNDATYSEKVSRMGLLAHGDSGIDPNDLSTLQGKSVGITEGSTSERYVRLFLEANGMSMDDVELVNMPVPDMPVSLEQQLVDAVAPWEPFTSQILLQQENVIEVERGGQYGADVVGIAAMEETFNERPEVVETFIAGMFEAAHYTRTNPEDAAQMASIYVPGIDEEVAVSAIEHHDYDPRVSVCTIEGVLTAANQLIEAGAVQMDRDFEVEDLFYLDLVEQMQADPQYQEFFEDLPPLPESVDECQ